MKNENVDKNSDVNETVKNLKKQRNSIIFVVILLVLLICGYVWSMKSEILSGLKVTGEKTQLKYTDSVSVKSEGVYITDVSNVVDEVMPSIVAITSKTVINSGRFGPSFYGNGSYTTEGAGSGVIVV